MYLIVIVGKDQPHPRASSKSLVQEPRPYRAYSTAVFALLCSSLLVLSYFHLSMNTFSFSKTDLCILNHILALGL